MHSAINREGKLQDQGKAVAVSGPIEGWAVGEKKAKFWVRIVQGDVAAQGESENWAFDRTHEQWDVVAKAPQGKKLQKGPAYAEYWARIQKRGGQVEYVYWPLWPIRLK